MSVTNPNRAQKRAMGERLDGSKTSLEFRELDVAGTLLCIVALDARHVMHHLDPKMINLIEYMFFYGNDKPMKMHERVRAFADLLQAIEERHDRIQISMRGNGQ